MRSTTARRRSQALILGCIVVLAAGWALGTLPRVARAAGVVGTGTPESCTDAAFTAALAGGGLVTFNCGPSLANLIVTEKTVAIDTVIDGGAGVLLSGEVGNRMFTVNAGVSLTLRHLRMTNGRGTNGGAILNYGTLTAEDTFFLGNRAVRGGALYNAAGATASLTRGSIADSITTTTATVSGGAIYSLGTLTLTDFTLQANSAGMHGGGIYSSGTTRLVRSGLWMNRADGSGGGIYAATGRVTLINSTLTGNQAGSNGGGVATSSTASLELRSSTVARNTANAGGGLHIRGSAPDIANTILARNEAWPGIGPDCHGAIVGRGYNLIQNLAACAFAPGSDSTGNLIGADPQLSHSASQSDYWRFHRLEDTSPAREAGHPGAPGTGAWSCPVDDQRRVTRPRSARCDIGAVEMDLTPPISTVTPTPSANGAGWHKTDVTVMIEGRDEPGGSGIVELVVDASGAESFSELLRHTANWSHTFTAEGITTLTYSVSDADNTETEHTLVIRIDKTAPAMTSGPALKFVPGYRLDTAAVPVTLFGWSAVDPSPGAGSNAVQPHVRFDQPPSGLNRYWVQQMLNGGAPQTLTLPAPLAMATVRQLVPGNTYRFQVSAVDAAGNLSAAQFTHSVGLEVFNEEHPTIAYAGAWYRKGHSYAYGGAVKYARAANASATFTFDGTAVAWVSTKGPDRGRARVSIDGGAPFVVDLYASSLQGRRIVFAANDLAPGLHTIEVRVLATPNPSSTGTRVDVDVLARLTT
jgi:hypothetical protein